MRRFGIRRIGQLLRGDTASSADDADAAAGADVLKWLGLGSAVIAVSIAAGMAAIRPSLTECALFAAVVLLAVTIALLLRRDQWFHRTLAAERRQLFADVQRVFGEQVPMLYFAAPRLYMGVSARTLNPSPTVLRPQLLWAADTIAVKH